MSKRFASLKKTMVLLSLGGGAFMFFGFGGFDDLGCVTNTGLVTFYQGTGDAAIESFRDSTANIIGSDFDAWILTPTAGFVTGLYDNWVAQQFPTDPAFGSVLEQ